MDSKRLLFLKISDKKNNIEHKRTIQRGPVEAGTARPWRTAR
ncbi:MAG: hypothetical protein NTW45_01050 [Rhodocyclales bacterium]|nr:hypothetical protein [Rhodocyclales bacterium]